MKELILTQENPDLAGFDLEGMAGLGAYPDGSGGGIRTLAWQMQTLRELRERITLLERFVRKYQLQLARLSWSLDADTVHPSKKEEDHAILVPQIELTAHTYDRQRVTAREVAALWPLASWRRSMPRWGDSTTERDYTADVDGVLIRISSAERLPEQKPVDRFSPCGPVRLFD